MMNLSSSQMACTSLQELRTPGTDAFLAGQLFRQGFLVCGDQAISF
jgi:hypothetical protein